MAGKDEVSFGKYDYEHEEEADEKYSRLKFARSYVLTAVIATVSGVCGFVSEMRQANKNLEAFVRSVLRDGR